VLSQDDSVLMTVSTVTADLSCALPLRRCVTRPFRVVEESNEFHRSIGKHACGYLDVEMKYFENAIYGLFVIF
jgi:hypothetical protein